VSFLSLYVRECICSRARRGDFETKKRKKKKKKKKTRSFVCSFALVRRREQTKHRRGETSDENFGAQKKTRGVPIQKNFLLGDGAIRFSLSLFLPCLWAALS